MRYFILPFLILTACKTDGPKGGPNPGPETPVMSECLIHSPKNVQMWINAMPGPESSPALIATFSVTAPTPGYEFELKVLDVMESYPPQYVFSLIATPPSGIVLQVETETDVRVEIPDFDYEQIASATVKCGDSTLFTVEKVETAY